MTERLAIAQATAFARDSGMEDFMIMARQQKGLASGATDSFYYGEAEMLPRHRAAVIRSVLDGVPTLMRSVACPRAFLRPLRIWSPLPNRGSDWTRWRHAIVRARTCRLPRSSISMM